MKRLSVAAVACVALLASASLALAQTASAPAKPATPAKAAPATSTPKATPATTAAPATGTTAAPATPAKPATPAASATPAKAALVDLNTASKEELMKLPGVGEVTAGKIIAGRPWASKSQLVSKGVCTQANYTKFEAKVIAKQAK